MSYISLSGVARVTSDPNTITELQSGHSILKAVHEDGREWNFIDTNINGEKWLLSISEIQDETNLPLVNDYSDTLPTAGLKETDIDTQARVNLVDGNEFVTFSTLTGQEVIDLINQPLETEIWTKFTNPNTGEFGWLQMVLNNPNGNNLLLISTSFSSSYSSYNYFGSGEFYSLPDTNSSPVPITPTFPIDGSVDLTVTVEILRVFYLDFQEGYNLANAKKWGDLPNYLETINGGNGIEYDEISNEIRVGGQLDSDINIDLNDKYFTLSDSTSNSTNIRLGEYTLYNGLSQFLITAANFSTNLTLFDTGNVQLIANSGTVAIQSGSDGISTFSSINGGITLNNVDPNGGTKVNILGTTSRKAYRYGGSEDIVVSDPNDIPTKEYVDDAISNVSSGGIEVGEFTPRIYDNSTPLTVTSSQGYYQKTGRFINFVIQMEFGVQTAGNLLRIAELPYVAPASGVLNADNACSGLVTNTSFPNLGSLVFQMEDYGFITPQYSDTSGTYNSLSPSDLSGGILRLSGSYIVNNNAAINADANVVIDS